MGFVSKNVLKVSSGAVNSIAPTDAPATSPDWEEVSPQPPQGADADREECHLCACPLESLPQTTKGGNFDFIAAHNISVTLPCGHKCHKSCFRQWLQTNHPDLMWPEPSLARPPSRESTQPSIPENTRRRALRSASLPLLRPRPSSPRAPTPERKRGGLAFLNSWLPRRARSQSKPTVTANKIGAPTGFIHLTHVGLNSDTGRYVGLPHEMTELISGFA